MIVDQYGNFYSCKHCKHSWLCHTFYVFSDIIPAPPAGCRGEKCAGCDCKGFEVELDG